MLMLRRGFLRFVLALLVSLWPVLAEAADRYWVGGSGTWDSSDTSHWSASSGGASGASAPTSADNAIFDSASSGAGYTVTVASGTHSVLNVTFAAPATGDVTLAGSGGLDVYGNFTRYSSMTWTWNGAITFRASSGTQVVTSAGGGWRNKITLNCSGATVQLADAFAVTASDANGLHNFILTAGTFDPNGQAFSITAVAIASFLQGAWNFYDFTYTGAAGKTYSLSVYADMTVSNTLTINGNSATNRVIVQSSTKGTQRTLTAATVSVTNADFQDINGQGAGSWNLSAITGGSGDAGGNSNITFTGAATQYWYTTTTGAKTWSDSTRWFLGSGGTGGAGRVPLPQDTARFDASSIGAASTTITQDMPRIGAVNWTGVTNTPTWTSTTAVSFFGSITLDSGMTLGGNATWTYEGRGASMLTSAGKTLQRALWIEAPGGSMALADALNLGTGGRYLYLFAGTFTVGANNVTATGFVCTGSATRVLNAGSSTWTLEMDGNLSVQSAGLTFNGQTATWRFTGALSANRNLLFGAQTYHHVELAQTSGAFEMRLGADGLNPTFTTLHVDASAFAPTIKVTAGRTITVGNFTRDSGTNVVTIGSITAATHTIASSNPIEMHHASISYSIAPSGSNAAFSTDGTNNTNWTFPTARYWVGGSGTWDSSTTTNWSATSGGAGGASAPTSANDVQFDLNSGASPTVTVSTGAVGRFVYFSAPTSGDITLAGSAAMSVYGSMILYPTLTRTYTGAITFAATSTGHSMDTAGVTLASVVTFNGTGGGWRLDDGISSSQLVFSAGTLDTNDQTISLSVKFNTSSASTRTLTLGSSSITTAQWDATITTGLTFNANTSTIDVTSAGGPFQGGGLTYNAVIFSTSGGMQISGANTFATLTRTGGASSAAGLTLAADQTVTGTLTLTGNSNQYRLFVSSTTKGTARTLTAAAVSASYVDLQDLTGAGAGSWDLQAITGLSGDAGGNSGIMFTSADDNFWIGGTGSWSDSAHWSTTTGGSADGRVPLPQDSAYVDGNSGTGTITQDMPRFPGADFTGSSGITWTTSTAASFFGDIDLTDLGTLSTHTNIYTYEGRGSSTLASAGKTWNKALTVTAPGGTLTLADALTTVGALSVTAGTFNSAGYNVTASYFFGTLALPRHVAMGASTWTLSVNSTFWQYSGTNCTLDAGTSTIRLTGTITAARQFSNGTPFTYHKLEVAIAGAFPIRFVASDTFNNIHIDASSQAQGVQFTAGTTTTVGSLTRDAGTNVITIGSITAATHTLSKSGGGFIALPYASISYSTGSPGSTWYAPGGTDGGNNSGWSFWAAPIRGVIVQ